MTGTELAATSGLTTGERGLIEFETPRVLGEVFPDRVDAPETLRQCSVCGKESQALRASELTVIKRRHGGQPLGHLRLYCHEHLADGSEWSETAS